ALCGMARARGRCRRAPRAADAHVPRARRGERSHRGRGGLGGGRGRGNGASHEPPGRTARLLFPRAAAARLADHALERAGHGRGRGGGGGGGGGGVGRARLGGAWACADAAVPAFLAVLVLLGLDRLMTRHWPDPAAARGRTVALPILFAIARCGAFFHPLCYYPDVDAHGRFLQALRDSASLLVDPTQPWQRRGDVTREIGGQKIPIPYAMVFPAAAWPRSPLLGDTGALKTVAVIAAAAVVLLVHPLARAAALDPMWAMLAQVLAAVLPVLTSR